MLDFLIAVAVVGTVTSFAALIFILLVPYIQLINEFFSDERNN